jgi:hypothetical protein
MDEVIDIEALKAEAREWQRDPRSPAKGYSIVQHLLVALDRAERTIVRQALELHGMED